MVSVVCSRRMLRSMLTEGGMMARKRTDELVAGDTVEVSHRWPVDAATVLGVAAAVDGFADVKLSHHTSGRTSLVRVNASRLWTVA